MVSFKYIHSLRLTGYLNWVFFLHPFINYSRKMMLTYPAFRNLIRLCKNPLLVIDRIYVHCPWPMALSGFTFCHNLTEDMTVLNSDMRNCPSIRDLSPLLKEGSTILPDNISNNQENWNRIVERVVLLIFIRFVRFTFILTQFVEYLEIPFSIRPY